MNVMTNAWLVLKSSYCQKLKKKTKTDGKLPSQGTRDLHSQRGGDGIPYAGSERQRPLWSRYDHAILRKSDQSALAYGRTSHRSVNLSRGRKSDRAYRSTELTDHTFIPCNKNNFPPNFPFSEFQYKFSFSEIAVFSCLRLRGGICGNARACTL